MSRYTYTAKSSPAKVLTGSLEAESEQDALQKLGKLGYFPISIQVENAITDFPKAWKLWKVSHRDIALFTRQLSTLLESGVNILNGLSILANQTPNKYFKAAITDISNKVKDGKALSDSFAAYPHLFPPLYTSMLHSGEIGGSLEPTLKRLADFTEQEEEFKNSLQAALTYPAFLIIISILTVALLMGFVIPRLVVMFEDMGQSLPVPTQMLIKTSAFLRAYWWGILAAVGMFVFAIKRSYQRPQGKIFFDTYRLKLPIAGSLLLKSEISRLMRTLSLLLSSGMPILYSLEISMTVLQNEILRLEVQRCKEKISSGANLSSCLKESNLFPTFVTNIVNMGEETGSLEKSLMRIADEYEKELDRTLKTLTRLLEPVIILVMGLVVGFIVLSMLLPIFQINLIVK